MGVRMTIYAPILMQTAIVAALLCAISGSTAAAEGEGIAYLARITGGVLVNQGQQYRDGTEGLSLSTGDRVMSLAESTAIIQFQDGCRYTMEENELVTIPSLSPCVLTKGADGRLSVATLPPAPPAQVPLVPVVPVVPLATNLAWLPAAAAGGLLGGGAILSDPDDDGDGPRPPISP